VDSGDLCRWPPGLPALGLGGAAAAEASVAAAWGAHVATLSNTFAVRGSVTKHGGTLGIAYRVLCARRLVVVTPADRDGARLTLSSAWTRVEGWHEAAQIATAVGARRRAA
jgi:hypothetical protein